MVLVDAGLSGKRTREALASFSLEMDDVDAIFLTHEHSDHVQGAGVLSRKHNLPIFATTRTFLAAEKRLGNVAERVFINSSDNLRIRDMEIESFSVSHDAADPVGFLFRKEDMKLGICSDLGEVPSSLVRILDNPDLLVMEANYEPELLRTGHYPPGLKALIESPIGHLSNSDAGDAISRIVGERSTDIILAHISENNNTTQKALSTVKRILNFHGLTGPRIHTTRHRVSCGPFSCGGNFR